MLSLPLSWCINQTKANAHPVTVSGLCKCYGTLCPGPSCSLALQRQAHWESRGSEELELPGVCVMEWHLRAHSRKDWTKQVEEYKEQKCGLTRLKRTGKQGALHFDSRILMKGNKQISKWIISLFPNLNQNYFLKLSPEIQREETVSLSISGLATDAVLGSVTVAKPCPLAKDTTTYTMPTVIANRSWFSVV